MFVIKTTPRQKVNLRELKNIKSISLPSPNNKYEGQSKKL